MFWHCFIHPGALAIKLKLALVVRQHARAELLAAREKLVNALPAKSCESRRIVLKTATGKQVENT